MSLEVLMNLAINHLRKSPTLQGAAQLANNAMDKINESHVIEARHLNDILNGLSSHTDEVILQFERGEAMKFIGGELLARKVDNADDLSLGISLYFDKDGKYILKKIEKILPLNILDEASRRELMASADGIKVEVVSPGNS